MNKSYIDGTKPIPPTDKLIKLANKINLEGSIIFDGNDGLENGGEKFRQSVAEEIQLLNQMMDQQGVKIGGLLEAVKNTLKHRQFMPWVEANCPFSHKTADNLRRLFKVTLDHPALIKMQKSLLYHIGSKNFPEKLTQQLADSVVGVYDFGKKDILKLQLKYLNGEISEDGKEFNNFLKKQHEINLFDRWKIEWKSIIKTMEKKIDHYDTLLFRQRTMAGRKVKNEYTAYWKSSITILRKAIEQFSSLYDGHSITDLEANNHRAEHKQCSVLSYSDPDEIDGNFLHSEMLLLSKNLAPDDLKDAGIVEDNLDYYYKAVLCADDLTHNNNGGCYES